ncbi:putative aldo-keto reductase [Auriculariales sp. MPI-PUGE-AT-0066]|nr:putative aldo-keto reductase [Auriculariales sp. MPI-PUGE-AT-0066]
MSLPTRPLGRNGPQVSTIGFGLMVNVYGANEDTLNRYFKARPGARQKVFLATKFGITYNDGVWGARGDAEYVTESANKALARLGIDYIDLFYVHRIDQKTPIEITMKALVQIKNEGKIRHIGLSEASASTLRRAHAIHPVAAHQVEYSPFELSIEKDSIDVLATCRELGIAVVAYSPLGRGMLTGKLRSPADFGEGDFRSTLPRFSPENFHKNLEVVDKFAEIAKKHNATSGQLALAWLLAQAPEVIPIPGTTRFANLEENVGAATLELGGTELTELDQAIRAADVVGERYSEGMLDLVYADTPAL